MEPFFVIENKENTYRIECKIVIYRHLLQFHPDFAQPVGDEKDGFYTKYYLLIKDDIPTKNEAQEEANLLNIEYKDIIAHAENTGNWDKFPFKDKPIIYYK